MLSRLRRHLLCKPRSETIPRLVPSGPLQEALISSLQFEKTRKGNNIIMYPKKALKLGESLEVLSWFELQDGVDILPYPSSTYRYLGCNPFSNTVLAYIAPVIYMERSPVRIMIPEIDYVTSVDELILAVKKIVKGKKAKIYVLSKYARPGNLQSFINSIETRRLDLFIASEERNTRKYKPKEGVWVIGTKSHRKLILIVIEDSYPTLVGYTGSMNIFYPGVDDYLEAVRNWREMQILLHGLLRAFLIV